MAYIVLTCPDCGRRIVMDEIDGTGYCMYCGARIDASATDAEYLDPQSESLMEMVVHGPETQDHSGEPWYAPMSGSVDLLMSGHPDEAAASFARALSESSPENRDRMKDAMAESLARWVLRTVFDGGVYGSGVACIAPLLVIEGQGDTHPPVLIESLFDAVCQSLNMLESPDHAESMAESLLHLLCDYMSTEPSLSNQEILIDEFVTQCSVLEDLIEQNDEEAPQIDSIEKMGSAASILLGSMRGISSEQTEGRMEELASLWEVKGIAGISGKACSVLTRVCDGSFEDDEASWKRISEDSETYAEAYFGLPIQ